MLSQVVLAVEAHRPGIYLDGTFGAGGYTGALLRANPDNVVIAVDRDPSVWGLPSVRDLLSTFGDRVLPLSGTFADVLLHPLLGTRRGVVSDMFLLFLPLLLRLQRVCLMGLCSI